MKLKKILFCYFLSIPIFVSGKDINSLEYIPNDESPQVKDFFEFKQKFLKAIKARDLKFLESTIDDTIETSSNKVSTKKDFIREKNFQDPNSRFWKRLIVDIESGCKRYMDYFHCPYAADIYPRNIEEYHYKAILKKKTEIKATPDDKAKTIGFLGYEFVEYNTSDSALESSEWLSIKSKNKIEGYIKKIDTNEGKLSFQKTAGGWKLTKVLSH